MTRSGLITLKSQHLAAAVSPHGAELQSLTDGDGRELLWDGDPAFWAARAPILFPVIGQMHGDGYQMDGRRYDMPKHGFARRMNFEAEQRAPGEAAFTMTDTPETRALYPFPFALDIRFALRAATLAITAAITNRGNETMPFSFGYHPAFRWPLPYGAPRESHVIRFDAAERGSLRRIGRDGFLTSTSHRSPIDGHELTLKDTHFFDDAMIFDEISSRSVRYGMPGQPALDVAFPEMSTLAIWTKPGAGYVCIEPWAGISEPADWDGDFREKPGVQLLSPGATKHFTMAITLKDDFNDR